MYFVKPPANNNESQQPEEPTIEPVQLPEILKAPTKSPEPNPEILKIPQTAVPEAVAPAEPAETASPVDLPSVGKPTKEPIHADACTIPSRLCECGQSSGSSGPFCTACGGKLLKNRYILVATLKDGTRISTELKPEGITIGKAKDCDLCIPDDFISRKHATLKESDGMIILEDNASSNGLYARVPGVIGLDIGDEILAGTTVLRLLEEPDSSV